MLRIAIISHLHFPIAEPFAGGLEKHTQLLACELQSRGHDVTVYALCGSGPGYKLYGVDLSKYSVDHDSGMDLPSQRRHLAYLEILQHIRQSSYDVIHNNSLHYLPMLQAADLGAPMVQVQHTPILDNLRLPARKARKKGSIRFLSVSSVTAADWGPDAGDALVIYNGIRLENWRFSKRAVPGLCVFIGRVVPEKGVHLAIEAARKAGKELIIAGPVADTTYFKEAIEPQLDRKIRYAGHLSVQETSRLLSNAECFIFSSIWPEPFGLVLAEALACGTPVAGFSIGAAREVLDAECAVLVKPGDADALAMAIRQAAYLDRSACRTRAQTHFALSKMVDQYEEVYYELSARRRGHKKSKITLNAKKPMIPDPSALSL